jgi:hypothetical protein
MDTNPAMRDGFQPAKYTNGISGFISAFSLQNSAFLHSTLNSQHSTLNRPYAFLVPQGQFQKHLHTLANLAKLLHKGDFR